MKDTPTMANVETNSTAETAYIMPAIRDAIQTFEGGKQKRRHHTKYQLEPWLVMAMSEKPPLTAWLPLTGMALLTMIKVFGAQVSFRPKCFVEDCNEIEKKICVKRRRVRVIRRGSRRNV